MIKSFLSKTSETRLYIEYILRIWHAWQKCMGMGVQYSIHDVNYPGEIQHPVLLLVNSDIRLEWGQFSLVNQLHWYLQPSRRFGEVTWCNRCNSSKRTLDGERAESLAHRVACMPVKATKAQDSQEQITLPEILSGRHHQSQVLCWPHRQPGLTGWSWKQREAKWKKDETSLGSRYTLWQFQSTFIFNVTTLQSSPEPATSFIDTNQSPNMTLQELFCAHPKHISGLVECALQPHDKSSWPKYWCIFPV